MDYVLGFAFNYPRTKVALIRKTHPAWQAGQLNGIGGKIELNETPMQAMIREFQEETSVKTVGMDWVENGILKDSDFNIRVFSARLNAIKFKSLKTTTDEEVIVFDVEDMIAIKPLLRDDVYKMLVHIKHELSDYFEWRRKPKAK